MTRHSLRAAYGMVLQDTWLKTGTIRDNIAMGRPDAGMDEIIEAAKASYIHSFIMRLPDGYDTWITEEGGGFPRDRNSFCVSPGLCCAGRLC